MSLFAIIWIECAARSVGSWSCMSKHTNTGGGGGDSQLSKWVAWEYNTLTSTMLQTPKTGVDFTDVELLILQRITISADACTKEKTEKYFLTQTLVKIIKTLKKNRLKLFKDTLSLIYYSRDKMKLCSKSTSTVFLTICADVYPGLTISQVILKTNKN